MKRLLKLLFTVSLTTPLTVNVVACGSNKSDAGNDVTENTNVEALLIKAKEQISLGLGNLIEQYKNLTFEDEFGQSGKNITNVLKGLDKDKDHQITDNNIKVPFLNRLQNDIDNYVIDQYLLQSSELKPLFGNIASSQILKIDIDQTILTKKIFKWDASVDFGIQNYNPTDYKISMWYKLTADLKLNLTYKNESNINSTIEIGNNYNFNYANPGANLRGLVDASTANVKNNLQNFIIKLENTIETDNDWNGDVKKALSKQIKNSKVVINNVSPEGITHLGGHYDYLTGYYMHTAVSKPTVAEAITSLQDYLTPFASEFATSVDNWVGTKAITVNKNNINAFGKYTINDWNISGLPLKPMSLDFVNARTDQTQIQWAEQTAKALGTIFCAKGDFAQGRIDLVTDGNLTLYMNPGDFDEYVSDDKKLSDISDYISAKINDKAKKENIIKNNIWTGLNGLWVIDPTLNNTENVERVDDKTFQIACGQGGMHGWNYLRISYESNGFLTGYNKASNGANIVFNNWIIKKADTNVW